MSQSANLALVNEGIASFRDRRFDQARQQLQTVLDSEPDNWRARLYLAMTYFQATDPLLALHHFRVLVNNCTDIEIREKAESAIRAIGKVDESKMPEMSCKITKPTFIKPAMPSKADNPAGAQEDLEWVSSKIESGVSRQD